MSVGMFTDFLQVDVFSNLLRNSGEKRYIYGFDEFSKNALIWLAQYDIYINGFIVENNDGIVGSEFLNKQVYSIQAVEQNYEEYIVIDLYGENIKRLLNYSHCMPIHLFKYTKGGTVAVYGAGNRGKRACRELELLGINVAYFIDQNPKKWGDIYCKKKIISPQEAFRGQEIPVIVSPWNNAQEIGNELSAQFKQVYIYGEDFFSIGIWVSPQGVGLNVYGFYYLTHILRERKLILLGKRENVVSLQKRLRLFDVAIDSCIDIDGFVGEEEDIVFKSIYDLLYLQADDCVLVMDDCREQVLKFIRTEDLDSSLFEYMSYEGFIQLERQSILDPNLGFNVCYKDKEYSVVTISNTYSKENPLRIGILGGSTSDVTLYHIKSWPEYLLDMFTSNNREVVFYVGAVAGQNVSQEFIKFVRDLSHLKLDILISYSGTNEIGGIKENPFVHTYQKTLFDRISAASQQNVWYGKGGDDCSEHWICQERMMNAVCRDLGIKFHAIYQPNFYGKKEKSPFDRCLSEFIGYVRWKGFSYFHYDNYQEVLDIHKSFSNKVKEVVEEYEWLSDFTNIFDGCDEDLYFDDYHLTEIGNQIVAEAIWNLLQDDVKNIREEYI